MSERERDLLKRLRDVASAFLDEPSAYMNAFGHPHPEVTEKAAKAIREADAILDERGEG